MLPVLCPTESAERKEVCAEGPPATNKVGLCVFKLVQRQRAGGRLFSSYEGLHRKRRVRVDTHSGSGFPLASHIMGKFSSKGTASRELGA